MKVLIIVPTYNERENISDLVTTIRKEVKDSGLHILVVDSASPDRTAEAVSQMQRHDSNLFLLEQAVRRGLGNAYQEGMRWALDRGYDRIVTMDADFSHHPRYLDSMLRESETCELVIGSR